MTSVRELRAKSRRKRRFRTLLQVMRISLVVLGVGSFIFSQSNSPTNRDSQSPREQTQTSGLSLTTTESPRRNSDENPPGEHWVDPYQRSDGTRVKGHYRTAPDNSFDNNWTTKGNRNPHTGKPGTRPSADKGSDWGGGLKLLVFFAVVYGVGYCLIKSGKISTH